jgi:hypothetical protein
MTNKAQRKISVFPVCLKEPQGVIFASLAEEYKFCVLSLSINFECKDLLDSLVNTQHCRAVSLPGVLGFGKALELVL